MRLFFRAAAVSLLTLSATLSLSQAHFKISMAGKDLGTARATQHLTADGGKFIELVMSIKTAGDPLVVRSQTTYDKKGNPIRKLFETGPEGKRIERQVVATFDSAGANVVIREKGVPHTVAVPLANGAPRSLISEFWVLRDKPAVGKVCRAYSFNMEKLQWELTESSYSGKVTGGYEVVMNVASREIKTLLDEKGTPILIEGNDGLRMERTKTDHSR